MHTTRLTLANRGKEVRRLMPFELLGFDTDNDSVFINEMLRDYCRGAGIVLTRYRPWPARTTRPSSSRRTARWSGASSATAAWRAWRAWRPPRRCPGFTRRRGCTSTASNRRSSWHPSGVTMHASASATTRRRPPSQRLLADPRTPAPRVRTRRRTVDVARSDPAASADAGASAARRGHRRPAGRGVGRRRRVEPSGPRSRRPGTSRTLPCQGAGTPPSLRYGPSGDTSKRATWRLVMTGLTRHAPSNSPTSDSGS